jgi:hypothetical protein
VQDSLGTVLPRRLGLLLAAVPVIAVALADGVIAARTASTHHPVPPATRSHRGAPVAEAVQRATEIRALLADRSAAVLHHDRAGFLATVDPAQQSLVAAQAREYAAIAAVPLASWSYELDVTGAAPPSPRSAKYGATTWAPRRVTLHYAIRGFDRAPTSLSQYPTFVRRGGRWYIASFNDFARAGRRSDVDIWDFGPVRVVRAHGVLVLGHPQSLALMHQVAQEASAAIPRVTAVWGRDWQRRVVVLVPTTQKELSAVVGDSGDLSQIAAVASAEVQDCPGPPNPVGNRVAVNPRNWGKLSALGRRVVLVHELTHVATRAVTGSCTPTWLVEGFADYVGYRGSGVPTSVVAQELAADVRAGRVPHRLPRDAEFAGGNKRLPQAYEGAWMAARLIASRWGQATLVRFYKAVGTAPASPSVAVADGFSSVLHTTMRSFVAAWRAYLRGQLS